MTSELSPPSQRRTSHVARRTLHITHLIARLNDGGPARVLASLGREMEARGHRVTVLAGCCAPDEPDLAATLRAQGMTVEIIAGLGRRVSPWSDVRAYGVIRQRLAELAPDVVHTHTAKAGALGRLACRSLGIPCLHTYHGHVLNGYFHPLLSLAMCWVERFCAWQHHHQALTPSLRDELCGRFRIGREKNWHVLPVPVEPVTATRAPWQNNLKPALPVIGFLGRLAPVKDLGLWLDTLAVLAARQPVQGLICGDGAQRAWGENRAQELGIPVLFTGFVPAGEALAVMDLLLITSRNEGLPLVAVEAAGVLGRDGVPVVAVPVGGLCDLIQQGLVQGAQRHPEALAAACSELLRNEFQRSTLQQRARILATDLSPSALAGAYEAMYRVTMTDRSGADTMK